MHKMKIFSTVVLLVVLLTSGQGMGATLYPSQFVCIWNGAGYEGYTGWNSLTSDSQYIGWAGGTPAGGGIAIYNYFANVAIGAGDFSMSDTATLHVTVVSVNNVGWGDPISITIYPLTAPYINGQASWNTRSTGVNWTNPGGDYDASISASLTLRASNNTPLGAHQTDITPLMEYWETHPNYGMAFICGVTDRGGSRSLGFENHATGAPYIEVVEAAAPANCAEVWAMGLGIASDLNHDCRINLADVAEFAADWLRCNTPGQVGCEVTW